ncbi:MAG: hypothetical protein K8F25_19085 [Fimbriimonadaceae bacterium]|nr:hypothetical protein [Alphaproteobacteria bacterium]
MADIVLSAAVRNNLLSLQNTAKLLGKTQERLATGLKVNSALDDPNAFFTSESLGARASDLSRLLDTVDLSVQAIRAADQGISSITKLVETGQALGRQALTSPNKNAVALGGTASLTPATDLVATTNITDGDTLTLDIGGTVSTVNFAAAGINTVQELLDEINLNIPNATATLTSPSGQIKIEATNGQNLTLGGNNAARAATELGLSTTAITGQVSTTRSQLAAQLDEILNQITQLSKDARFDATNLLDGDNLTVIFNENGSSSLTVNGVDFTATGLGLNNAGNNFLDDASIDTAMTELGAALTTLRTQARTLGSNLSVVEVRKDFTANLINTLETGAADLTLADVNEEGANLLALQTRQQLSSTALSLASQADQNVLRLFQ